MTVPRPSAPDSGVPPTVKGLALVSLFNDMASEMVYPLLPAFITGVLGGSAVLVGALDGASDLTSAALKWVSGRLSDRPGWRRPLILGGYATAVLIRPVIAIASSAWQVLGFRVVDRVGKGLRTPPRDALIAEVTPPASRGRAFGFHRAADHFGAVIGSLAAWWFLQQGAPVRDVIGWSAVPGVVAVLVLAAVLRGTSGRAAITRPTAAGAAPPAARGFWLPVLALGAIVLARVPEALLLLRLQDLGVAIATIPLVWAGLHVVRSAASYPGGWITDRLGARWIVGAGSMVFAGAVAALSRPLTEPVAVAVFLAFGLVAGLTEAAERATVSQLAPVRTGRAFGAYHAVTGVALLPAGIVFGEVYQRAGGGAALLLSAAAVTVAGVAWLIAAPRGGAK